MTCRSLVLLRRRPGQILRGHTDAPRRRLRVSLRRELGPGRLGRPLPRFPASGFLARDATCASRPRRPSQEDASSAHRFAFQRSSSSVLECTSRDSGRWRLVRPSPRRERTEAVVAPPAKRVWRTRMASLMWRRVKAGGLSCDLARADAEHRSRRLDLARFFSHQAFTTRGR
jgi:hypothetical protein